MKEQTEPQYFAISKEEWQEYQDLKLKKQVIDYDKLRTGSKVMLKYTGGHCAGSCKVDFKKPFFVVFKRIDCFMTNYDNELRFTKSTISESIYNTFIQDGKFIHFTASDESYITEVIEY